VTVTEVFKAAPVLRHLAERERSIRFFRKNRFFVAGLLRMTDRVHAVPIISVLRTLVHTR
jgi:hypothetical protein